MRDVLECFISLVASLWFALLFTAVVVIAVALPFPMLAKVPLVVTFGAVALYSWLMAYDDFRDVLGR
jgi:hypothetical protein